MFLCSNLLGQLHHLLWFICSTLWVCQLGVYSTTHFLALALLMLLPKPCRYHQDVWAQFIDWHVLSQKPDVVCEPCLASKRHSKLFSSSLSRSTKSLELVHSNLHSPLPVATCEGYHYWITFLDSVTFYQAAICLKHKSQALKAFKLLKASTENQLCMSKVPYFSIVGSLQYLVMSLSCLLQCQSWFTTLECSQAPLLIYQGHFWPQAHLLLRNKDSKKCRHKHIAATTVEYNSKFIIPIICSYSDAYLYVFVVAHAPPNI